jgi:cyclophilin family peptidyl-prolyl cis-trans isomerase
MPANQKNPNNQKKPINPKKRAIQTARKRESKGRIYLIALLVLVIVVGVGWYVYASAQSANQNMTSTGIVYAKLGTSNGTIEVELYQNIAPKTVTNFVNLAKSGFYNNLVWHRIVKGFVIQTGDPNSRNGGGNNATWGQGGSSQTVPLEIDASLHNNVGYLGMARSSDPNSGSSQFYINLANNNSLDGQYTVFGKVISGMDAAYAIGNVPVYPQSNQPINPVYVTAVTISSSP